MAEKRLYEASILLVQSLRQINTQEMQDISAMSDLRVYLIGQESVSTVIGRGYIYLTNVTGNKRDSA